MKNKFTSSAMSLAIIAALTASASAAPIALNLAFTEDAADVADEAAGIGGFTDTHVVAGVDTDGDGAQEIIAVRVNGSQEYADLVIFEYTGTDDDYDLVYSDRISSKGTPSGSTTYGSLIVADTDGVNGDEIIVFFSGPTVPTSNMHVYVNNGDNDWGSGQTAADDEYSQALLVTSEAEGAEIGGSFAEDIDGDGDIEIIVADDDRDNIVVFTINGTFGAGATLNTAELDLDIRNSTPALGGSAFSVAPSDLNNDGQNEIFSVSWNNLGLGLTDVTGVDTYAAAAADNPGSLYANDVYSRPNGQKQINFDGDSINTMVVLSNFHGDLVTVAGVASGAASTVNMVPTVLLDGVTDLGATLNATVLGGEEHIGQEFVIADLDQDGSPELVYAYVLDPAATSNGEIAILEYVSGPETAFASYELSDSTDTGATLTGDVWEGLAAGAPGSPLDMDGDGLAELVAISTGASGPMIHVFEGPASSVSHWNILN